MKKIKHSRHLKKERQHLRQRRIELEAALLSDWHGIRHNFKLASLAKEAVVASSEWIGKLLFARKD
ncbi:MAG TPA: hypothetical protein VL727_06280 [Puia sp.]|nr:hypothetical protein [Puia sp.]